MSTQFSRYDFSERSEKFDFEYKGVKVNVDLRELHYAPVDKIYIQIIDYIDDDCMTEDPNFDFQSLANDINEIYKKDARVEDVTDHKYHHAFQFYRWSERYQEFIGFSY